MKSLAIAPYRYFHKALPKAVCEAIISQGTAIGLQDAVIYHGDTTSKDDEWRSSKVAWFDRASWITRLLQSYVEEANLDAKWNYELSDFEKVQFTEYAASTADYYRWHRDFNVASERIRKLSVTVQLSDPSDYEGGQFEFKSFWTNEILPLDSKVRDQGTILIFPSVLEHQVTAVTSGVRYSLVQWYSGPDFI